jgi:histidinol dehydrogenase
MLRIVHAKEPEGRRELDALFSSRLAPDFGALRDAMPIVEDVLSRGRAALVELVARLDGVTLREDELVVDPRSGPEPRVDARFARAFRAAARRITAYHRLQKPRGFAGTDRQGVSYRESPIPHAAAGVYVPGGRAFYPSSLMMGVLPARVAGVPRIVVATPPRAYRESPELRWALRELDLGEVLLAGGAHGIAGLVSIAGCTKIVGPGNRWVAAAKHLVSSLVSIDLPAGPSEVLILASRDAGADLVAADLLAQAEHDPEAMCLLFTDSARFAAAVSSEIEARLESLPTRETASRSLEARGRAFVFRSLSAAAAAAGRAAVEHVQLMGKQSEAFENLLTGTAGALFAGQETPAAFGDYLAGPNHVLPTGGAARSFSGLSTRDFYRWGRRVRFSSRAARSLAGSAATLARFEGLEAHARALDLRGRA